MPLRNVNTKISKSRMFDCADLTEFINAVIHILPFGGASMSRFYVCEYRGVQFMTKVGFYRKSPPELYDKRRRVTTIPHIDAEIRVLKVLKRKFIDANITPCILELVFDRICSRVRRLAQNTDDCGKYMLTTWQSESTKHTIMREFCRYADMVSADVAFDKCAFLVLERCDISLSDYLRRNTITTVTCAIVKSIIFLIIYTLHAIKCVYPGFRHYDLHTNNVMLKFDVSYVFRADRPQFDVYTIDGVDHNVPYFGITPKIIDFGYSVIPEENIMSSATADIMVMYHRADNDLLFLFRWIYIDLGFNPSSQTEGIDALLDELDPKQTHLHYHTPYIAKTAGQVPSYEKMLSSAAFADYRNSIPAFQVHKRYTPITRKK